MDLIHHNWLRSFSCERYRTMTDYLLARGSRAARRPSPTNEKLNIVKAIMTVGKSPKCQYTSMNDDDCPAILPQLGMGSLIPIPKKLNPASANIVAGIPRVNEIISGDNAFGNRWRHAMLVLVTPIARAASMYSFSRSDNI